MDDQQALAPPDDDSAALVASLPPWQRRFLAARQSGLSSHDAARVCNVSLGSVLRRITPASPDYEPALARAVLLMEAGRVLFGPDVAVDLAQAASGGLVLEAIDASRDAKVRGRDQYLNRRLALEVAGVVGAGAGPAQTTAVQVNIGEIAMERALRRQVSPIEAPEKGEKPPARSDDVKRDA